MRLWSKGKAGLYCDTVPSQATIRPGGAQAAGAGAHWARSRRKRGAGVRSRRRRGAGARSRRAGTVRARARRVGRWARGARSAGGRGARARQASGSWAQAQAGGSRARHVTAGARQGTAGARQGCATGHGMCTAGARGGRDKGTRGTRQWRAGRTSWSRAVHLVHSACFWPDLTQYCSLTRFMNTVHHKNFRKKNILNLIKMK